MRMTDGFSVIVPVLNEEKIIRANARTLVATCEKVCLRCVANGSWAVVMLKSMKAASCNRSMTAI